MGADGIQKARKQKFTRGIGTSQETGNQMPRSPALPFLAGKWGEIDKSALGFVAVQKTFFEQAVEGGHDRGVRERAAQPLDRIADVALSVPPEDFHQFELQAAEGQGWAGAGGARNAIFEKADHDKTHATTFSDESRKGPCPNV